MKLTFKGSQGINGWGWYAYVENGLLFIGWNDPHEGGIVYEGDYEGDKTPYLDKVKEENVALYNSIVKYFDGYSSSEYKDIVMNNASLTDMEKLNEVFSVDKENIKKHFPQLYYAILAILDAQKKPDSTSYFSKE